MRTPARSLVVGLISAFAFCFMVLSPQAAEASITVTNAADAGVGSLTNAIVLANASSGPDTIVFAIGSGTTTITMTAGGLPTSTEELIIDGWTQPGWVSAPLINVYQTGGFDQRAFVCTAKCTIRGIAGTRSGGGSNAAFVNFMSGANDSSLVGSWIHVSTTSAVLPNYPALYVEAQNVTIGGTGSTDRNVIVGATPAITFTDAANNATILGNYIGTNVTGTLETAGTIYINGADNVTIGGTTTAARNVIGGSSTGVIARYGANNLKVYGNYFGIKSDGTGSFYPNNAARMGLTVASSTNIEVGTSTQSVAQVIASNRTTFISYPGVSTTNVGSLRVYNNYFNLVPTGLSTTGSGHGLQLDNTSSVTIGGAGANERNVFGMSTINGNFVENVAIKNNYIGSDMTGNAVITSPSGFIGGITLTNATSVVLGGDSDAERNVLFATAGTIDGFSVVGGSDIRVKSNFFGLNASGIQTGSGNYRGITMSNVSSVFIGSTSSQLVLGNNGGNGINISNATSIWVFATAIATNIQKSATLTSTYGLQLTSVTSVRIGGSNVGEGNTIIGNTNAVFMNTVYDLDFLGNIINLNASGTVRLGGDGVLIRDSRNLTIGGASGYEGNVFNATNNGLFLDSTVYVDRPIDATIKGNIFGFNASGTRTYRFNTDALYVDQGFTDVQIGGPLAGESNVFGWGNWGSVELWRNRNITIQGNYFGYTSSTSLFSGTRRGIIFYNTTNTVIGGANPGEGNYFGTSTQNMVHVESSTSSRLYGNYFGMTTSGQMLASTSTQIYSGFNTYDLHVGGATQGMGNYIAKSGYGFYHENSINTQVLGNVFGMSPTSTTGYGFIDDAIFIGTGSTNTAIGDGTFAGANSIGDSGFAGIELFRATSTSIYGNFFGTNTTTVAVAPNDYDIYSEQTYLTAIGGSVAGQGNVFAYTNFDAVTAYQLSRALTISGNTFGASLDHAVALPISGNAIDITGLVTDSATIGGLGANDSNWISNAGYGIDIDTYAGPLSVLGNVIVSSTNIGLRVVGDAGALTIQGNYIGVDTSLVARPNNQGVSIDDPTAESIIFGGMNSADENIVAYNTGAGIVVDASGAGLYVMRNRVYGNGGLQVDLGNDGPTANDANDADVGANALLNYPIPLGVNGMFAGYAYAGLASQQIIMDVYFSSSTDSFGRGQLMQYATSVVFTTDGSGTASGYVDISSYGYNGTDKIAFLAHNASNTSEMSGATGGMLGVALAASSTDNFDNTSDVEFTYTLVNYGSDVLTNMQLVFSRAAFFPLVSGITIVSAPVSSDPNLIIDGAFDGDADATMLNAGASTLNGNTTATISFILNVPHSGTGLFSGYATTSGDVLGFSLQDVSVSGTVPDVGNGVSYDGDLDPTNNTLITTLNLPTYTPPTPEVSFVLDAQTISETAGTATVNIILNAATSATDIVATYSVGGTASDPADFLTPSGSFTILAGESATSVQIALVNDTTIEIDKTIVLSLTSITPNATTGATTTHTITLQSEDVPPPPELEFSSFTSNVNEGDGMVTVELELSGTDASDVNFTYSVSGTAAVPADFGALSGSGAVLAGDTTTTISIALADDGFYESAETIVLNLEFISTNAASGTRLQHTMTITDNDVQPAVSFAVTSTSGLEAGLGSVLVEVFMDATSSLPVGIEYLIGGSALMGSDIGTLSGYAEIAALATSTTITINVADDFAVELDENVTLTLSSVSSHAMIGATSSYELIIQNDDAIIPPAPPVASGGSGALSCNQLAGGCGGAVLPVVAAPTTTTSTTDGTEQSDSETPVTPAPDNGDNGPIMSIDPGSTNACMKEVAGVCTPYLKSFIRYGSKNSPEEVKKLQLFLRDTMGMKEVKVTGIYDLVSLRAVMKFQSGLGKDVLSPWSLSSPTGYVYITTSRAINRIYCQKNPPKPQTVNTCDTGCLKKIQNSEGKDTYIDVCKKTISCVPLLTKTVSYGAKANNAIEVERLQVALNMAIGRSKKPTRIFDAATRNDLNGLVKAYFPEEKTVLSLVGGKPGMLGDKIQAFLNASWCEK